MFTQIKWTCCHPFVSWSEPCTSLQSTFPEVAFADAMCGTMLKDPLLRERVVSTTFGPLCLFWMWLGTVPSASAFKHALRTKRWEEWNFAASSHYISLCAELTKIFRSRHWEPPLPPNPTLRPTLRNPLRGLRVPFVMHAVRVRFPCALVSARSFFFLACVHLYVLNDTRLVHSLAFYVRTLPRRTKITHSSL